MSKLLETVLAWICLGLCGMAVYVLFALAMLLFGMIFGGKP